ncbi:MAG: hypothetical protein ABS81_10885 [Pseudonocardia sp. SCN 72-86]|nr:MAG: hypothetical protein ABS81_10885 [Pseudonocardia sp. SCN 72-86]
MAELAALELNRIHRLQIDGRTVGVVRTRAGVFAIGNRCPHQGGPMCSGRVSGTMLASGPDQYVYGEDGLVIRCPWHAYEFHLATGESIGGVVRGRVPVFEAIVRGGAVYVSLTRPRTAGAVR